MKLFEIAGLFDNPAKTNRSRKEYASSVHNRTGQAAIGSGAFATAYQDTNDENKVNKIGNTISHDPEEDGYVAFLNAVRQLHNPCFPQIDDAKAFKPNVPSDVPFYRVKMEKLENTKNLSMEDLEMLVRNTFTEPVADQLMHYADETAREDERVHGPGEGEPRAKRKLLGKIAMKFIDVIRSGNKKLMEETIGNRAVRQALVLLTKLHKDMGYTLDVHPGNFMVRRTANGPMFVFTDPFTDRWKERRANMGNKIPK